MQVGGRRIEIRGTVQGVGFRPWVYRLAQTAGLSGSVRNDSRGVTIEAFGPTSSIDSFVAQLESSPPPPAAHIRRLHWQELASRRIPAGFVIIESVGGLEREVSIPPDLATCTDCIAEIFDPADRRYRYPFINCTNCGPRLTITTDLPYDRPATTMAGFEMCFDCRTEYSDPADRRFHAQPNACPLCGPQLQLSDSSGSVLAHRDKALIEAARALAQGRIVAAKGLGGFHLLVDARNGTAVARLRRRKHRVDKPLALMVPDIDRAHKLCVVSPAAEKTLRSAGAPIVLLEKRQSEIAPEVAPGTPCFGLMLPYTPLHHLLLAECGFPLVATSGNLSDEPISIDNEEALARLGGIADLFLVHDRPIERHADDSIVWLVDNEPRLLRRARGYAPLPIALDRAVPTVLAVGSHMKSAVALSMEDKVFISQHIGDMETPEALAAFEHVIADFLRMLEAEPVAVVHDLHSGYPSTAWVERAVAGYGPPESTKALTGLQTFAVQHHHAHLVSCLVENRVEGPALGVTWDGTGYGTDGTIWGGEFLLGDASGFERVAHLRPFRLAGGDAAVREPRRIALALLWELHGEAALELDSLAPIAAIPASTRQILGSMLRRGVNSPITTSAGRLFDGISALLGLHQRVSFEGQAAMALETVAANENTSGYSMPLVPSETVEDGSAGKAVMILDWRPAVEEIRRDLDRGVEIATISARFHDTLAEVIAEVAATVGVGKVALTGGCFQNRMLTERTRTALQKRGLDVLLHRDVPPNDGGISLGQIAVAAARLETGKEN